VDISGSYTLYATRERVWSALRDPDLLRRIVPGCESLEMIDANTYHGRVNIGIAAVKGVYEGTLRMSEQRPPESCRMVVDGKGAQGVLHGEGTVALEEREPGVTVVRYAGQAQLGGAIASVGMRVASGAANMLTRGFFAKLADVFAEESAAPVAAAVAMPPADVLDSASTAPPLSALPTGTGATHTTGRTASAPVLTPTETTARSAPAYTAPTTARSSAPPRRSPLMRFARRAGLSDGSIESERRWANVLLGGIAAATVLVATLAFVLRRVSKR
jgi:carbon monoxide dehydrogenase subunit G